MNDQPNTSEFKFKSFATSPQPSGFTRFVPHLRGLAAGSALATLGFFALQLALPDGWRPSDILGNAAGLAERHEIEQKSAAKIEFERRLADATSQAQAKSNADLAAITKALDERTQSLQVDSTIASLADAACFGSMALAWLGSENTGRDWHNGAVQVAQSACGTGDKIRQDVTRSQLDAMRSAAAARGAPMTNGAVAPGTQGELAGVYAISKPSQHYDYGDVQKVKDFATSHFPADVQQHLMANLPSNNSGWDVYVDRVRAYVDLESHRG